MKCFICHLEYGASNVDHQTEGDKKIVDCPRCGRYEITGTAAVILEHSLDEPDFQLSAYLREHAEGRSVPILLNSDNLESFRKSLPRYSVAEKMQKCLRAFASWSQFPGDTLKFHGLTNFVTAWANSVEEYAYLVTSLIERGLLEGQIDESNFEVRLTAEGWNSVEANHRNRSKSSQAFIAMSFSPELTEFYRDGIEPAIRLAGYSAYRVDHDPHNERIDAKIANEIKNSKFLIADVTEQKAGVYYEAGYAQGLGLEVIWCVRADDLDNVHFDTRQYAHIVWTAADDLREALQELIEAVIGPGPIAPPAE